MADAAKGVGRPKVGGTFELLDHEGKAFTDQELRGVFSLVSFTCASLAREERSISMSLFHAVQSFILVAVSPLDS